MVTQELDSPTAWAGILGCTFAEEAWPEKGVLWAFTYQQAGPAFGMTFYMKPGSSLNEISLRLLEKCIEFGATKPAIVQQLELCL